MTDESVNRAGHYETSRNFVWCDKCSHWVNNCRWPGTSSLSLYVTVAYHWLPPPTVSLSRVQSLLYVILGPTSVCFLCHQTRSSFKPRLHGELCEEVGGSDGEGFRRAADRVQGRAVHTVVGSQSFWPQQNHGCDHTCACSATDDSSEYVFLLLIICFYLSFCCSCKW